MLKTFKELREFYRQDTKAPMVHKILTYAHYFIYQGASKVLPKKFVKHVMYNYIPLGFMEMKLPLKDGIVINHHLEDYGILMEVIHDDLYKLKDLKKGAVVVDVGANIGTVSVLCDKRAGADKVISFEPCSNNYSLLEKNVKDNNCKNVSMIKKAVSSKPGEAKLFLHGAATHSLYGGSTGKYEVVPLVTLDDMLKDETVIDFLKIDVEGAEMEVLKGAQKSLEKVKLLVMESHLDLAPEAAKLKEILEGKGFTVETDKEMVMARRK